MEKLFPILILAAGLIPACADFYSPNALNETEIDQILLQKGYSQEQIDKAYLIGDETGDYDFIDAAD